LGVISIALVVDPLVIVIFTGVIIFAAERTKYILYVVVPVGGGSVSNVDVDPDG
jgi:hypothetical protein